MTAPAQAPSPEAMAAADEVTRTGEALITIKSLARSFDAFAAKRVEEEWDAAIEAAAILAVRRSADKRFGNDIRKLKRGTK